MGPPPTRVEQVDGVRVGFCPTLSNIQALAGGWYRELPGAKLQATGEGQHI